MSAVTIMLDLLDSLVIRGEAELLVIRGTESSYRVLEQISPSGAFAATKRLPGLDSNQSNQSRICINKIMEPCQIDHYVLPIVACNTIVIPC